MGHEQKGPKVETPTSVGCRVDRETVARPGGRWPAVRDSTPLCAAWTGHAWCWGRRPAVPTAVARPSASLPAGICLCWTGGSKCTGSWDPAREMLMGTCVSKTTSHSRRWARPQRLSTFRNHCGGSDMRHSTRERASRVPQQRRAQRPAQPPPSSPPVPVNEDLPSAGCPAKESSRDRSRGAATGNTTRNAAGRTRGSGSGNLSVTSLGPAFSLKLTQRPPTFLKPLAPDPGTSGCKGRETIIL